MTHSNWLDGEHKTGRISSHDKLVWCQWTSNEFSSSLTRTLAPALLRLVYFVYFFFWMKKFQNGQSSKLATRQYYWENDSQNIHGEYVTHIVINICSRPFFPISRELSHKYFMHVLSGTAFISRTNSCNSGWIIASCLYQFYPQVQNN